MRAVYLADTTADVRMLEGLAARMDSLVLVAPASLGERLSTGAIGGHVRCELLAGGAAGFNLRAARWLVRNRREHDVVFVLDNLRAAAAANVAAVLTRKPVIIQLGRPTEDYFRCKRAAGTIGGLRYAAGLAVLKALVWWNERRAARVGAISEYVAAQCRRRTSRVVRVPWYGVDLEAFAPRGTRADARRALGLPPDASIVLFRSRLAAEKDPQTFMRAMRTLGTEGRDVVALYVGAEYRDIEVAAAQAGVACIGRDHVHPLLELPVFYRAADVCVQTSHQEGLGMSPLESLACGTPCVVTGVGGLVEVAAGGEAALVVPPRDPEAAARAIAWILDHPERAEAMARRGREHVRARYASEDAFDAWSRLAREAVGAPHEPAEVPAR